MKLRLYWSTQHKSITVPSNKRFGEVVKLLEQLKKRGIGSEIIDTDSLSEDEINIAYQGAVVPSVNKKFGIRRVFGSRRRSGCLFGREVPALLVYEEGEQYPYDVYPHEVGQGRIITIYEYLQGEMTSLLLGYSSSK